MNQDHAEKYAAAREQVISETADMYNDIILSAYRKAREYIASHTTRSETDFKVINETLEKLLACSMYNVFLSIEQRASDGTIRSIADKAARDFGIAPLDPNKVIQ